MTMIELIIMTASLFDTILIESTPSPIQAFLVVNEKTRTTSPFQLGNIDHEDMFFKPSERNLLVERALSLTPYKKEKAENASVSRGSKKVRLLAAAPLKL